MLLGACAQAPVPSSGTPSEDVASSALPRPSTDPCISVLSLVGTFSQRLADDLASLRPLVVAKSFDAPKTQATIRAAAATMNQFGGLESTAAECASATLIAAQIAVLRSEAKVPFESSLAAYILDSQTIRAGAVALLGLLPKVRALADATLALAFKLDVEIAVVDIPAGATTPIGSLPPLATPRPTPRPTSTPTKRPTTKTGGGAGSGSSSYQIAVRYLDSVQSTYSAIQRTASELWGFVVEFPGYTPDEVAARKSEARQEFKTAVSGIGTHLSLISKHNVSCLKDAYARDKPLATAWRSAFRSYVYPSNDLPENRAALYDWQALETRTDAFLRNLSKYVSDCR